jgi:hypothetical protein
MGGMAQGQQGSQVYYDPEMGQYYTNSNNPMDVAKNMMFLGLNNQYTNANNLMSRSGRNYIQGMNGFGQSNPAMQKAAPYEYANTSLESLFPMLQNAMQTSQGTQGGGNSALAGLLSGSPSATGSASSGAGRFL